MKDAMWIDLFSPSPEENALIEKTLNISVPTKEEMHEIELSSRLYRENDSLFMTAMMLANSTSKTPEYEPITFILNGNQMLTLRYIEPQSFKLFISRIESKNFKFIDATNLLLFLLDTASDRLADVFEMIGNRLSDYSLAIFHNNSRQRKIDYNLFLRRLGATGTLNNRARESLETFGRLLSFLSKEMNVSENSELGQNIKLISDDIRSLNSHVNFISSEINFLLNAALGMINIEQNNIIKIFSIMAVIFLPPTLIATIYGMNFKYMPELSWDYGYPYALGLIVLTAWLPYIYFKIKKWM